MRSNDVQPRAGTTLPRGSKFVSEWDDRPGQGLEGSARQVPGTSCSGLANRPERESITESARACGADCERGDEFVEGQGVVLCIGEHKP
ncbi:hypothetical protein F441_03953 [Phytophthora nicotianae CJ01A1]|uniref:Uncharacterized protein n=1 Tax=Phytophthora nicotianae CJ01A1 TaxID=1317063 RepID=W2XIY3_PHYNI|nr:hypothetical protein F441_03953 [Phytophthora nicotianae CJ01A1]